MKCKMLRKSISIPILVFAAMLFTALLASAQEANFFDIQGISQEDTNMVENIKSTFNRIISEQESLVKNEHTTRNVDEELTKADEEALEIIQQRIEKEKNLPKEKESIIKNAISFYLTSYDENDIKKIYRSTPSFLGDFKAQASLGDIISNDYFWRISGKTKESYNPFIYITVQKDGTKGNMHWKENPIYLTNDQVNTALSEFTASDVEIEDFKYVELSGNSLDLKMTFAFIETSDNQEYAIPVDEQGAYIGLNLQKGIVYTAEDFISELCRYEPTVPLVNNDGEVAAGTAGAYAQTVKKSSIPLGASVAGILIGIGGLWISKKS